MRLSDCVSYFPVLFWWDFENPVQFFVQFLMRFFTQSQGALFWWDLHTLWPSNDTAVLYCSYWLQEHNSIQKGDGIEAEHTHNLMEATCHAWKLKCPIYRVQFWWDFKPMSYFSVQFLMRQTPQSPIFLSNIWWDDRKPKLDCPKKNNITVYWHDLRVIKS